MGLKIAIVGSTDITTAQAITADKLIQALIIKADYDYHSQVYVISGGAQGIDTIAKNAAIAVWSNWLEFFIEYLPEGKGWEFYKSRNIKIAEACDVLWCIRSSQSKTYGSGWTADYAERLGKEVHRVTLPYA